MVPAEERLIGVGGRSGNWMERIGDGFTIRGIAQYKVSPTAETWDGLADWEIRLRRAADGTFQVIAD